MVGRCALGFKVNSFFYVRILLHLNFSQNLLKPLEVLHFELYSMLVNHPLRPKLISSNLRWPRCPYMEHSYKLLQRMEVFLLMLFFFYSRAMTFINNSYNRYVSPTDLWKVVIYVILNYLGLFTVTTRQFKGRHYSINTEQYSAITAYQRQKEDKHLKEERKYFSLFTQSNNI